MKRFFLFTAIMLLSTANMPTFADSSTVSTQNANATLAAAIPGFVRADDTIYTGGQPKAEPQTWEQLKQAGVTTVINLRSYNEMQGNPEPSQVTSAGMSYVAIPIGGANEITQENAQRLRTAIDNAEGNVLVHCASGNRVGALLAIDAANRLHLTTNQAIAYGKKAGLTSLEKRTRNVIDGKQ